MGSSYGVKAPVPASQKPPKGKRVHTADVITSTLVQDTIDNVLRCGPDDPNLERECYQVSLDLRGRQRSMEWLIHDLLAGSELGRPTLATKIVMIYIDLVNLEIIRPGPTPADRQSSDIAVEMREFGDRFVPTCREIIAIDDKALGL